MENEKEEEFYRPYHRRKLDDDDESYSLAVANCLLTYSKKPRKHRCPDKERETPWWDKKYNESSAASFNSFYVVPVFTVQTT